MRPIETRRKIRKKLDEKELEIWDNKFYRKDGPQGRSRRKQES